MGDLLGLRDREAGRLRIIEGDSRGIRTGDDKRECCSCSAAYFSASVFPLSASFCMYPDSSSGLDILGPSA